MGILVKKRQLLTATMIIALGAAVAVNWYYNNINPQSIENNTTVNESVSGNLGDSILVAGTMADQENKDGNDEDNKADSDKENSDVYFSQAKLKKNEANDMILDAIDDITAMESVSEQELSKLQKLFDEYANTIKCQTDAENLIYAKTGSECVVIINDGTCQVILEKNTLNDTIILQITEIIEKNTNISAENLSIIEVK